MPPAVLQRRERTARRRVLLGVPLAAAVVVAVTYGLLAQQAMQARAVSRETEEFLKTLRPVAVRLAQLQAETEALEARRARVRALVGRPGLLSSLLEDLGRLIPRNAWLQSVVVEGTTVTIVGSATDLSAVGLFAATLPRSRVLADVQIRSVRQTQIGTRTVTQFQLAARLR
ncbi:MAG: PilN domain-containing protein [Armatimonadota bacterium]|nr:PilN domain-containing protein [Armatimonadota bacterium]MDR7466618.1 PilN domain-containing protein [Armatimonadota bacterium]MDR7492908.1 PilN domain-containing protein [Armatimonadota bacterium]MDR7504648.1 PilN domain-containing protein [Armatimonadota bacterium]MDR7547015.1 PilN domain-containing protein [Armatimonadota bacterium]